MKTEAELFAWAEAHVGGGMESSVARAVLLLRDSYAADRADILEVITKGWRTPGPAFATIREIIERRPVVVHPLAMNCIRVVNVRGIKGKEQRASVCYVGRACSGWPDHPLGNPFKVKPYVAKIGYDVRAEQWWHDAEVERVVAEYRQWLRFAGPAALGTTTVRMLAALWEECRHGELPLGCWCTTAVYEPGWKVVCHAQVLAEELHGLVRRQVVK